MDIRHPAFRRAPLSLCAGLAALTLVACASHGPEPETIVAAPQASMPAASASNSNTVAQTAIGAPDAACNVLLHQRRVSAAEVLASCGQPAFRDSWGAAVSIGRPDLAPVEEWYYNPGPGASVQVLRFLQGNLIAVNQDGQGFNSAQAAQGCSSQDVRQGLSKYRLTVACGQPLTRQSYVVDPSYRLPNAPVLSQGNAGIVGQRFGKPAYREDLGYRFQGGQVQNVTLENGRVLGVGDRVGAAESRKRAG